MQLRIIIIPYPYFDYTTNYLEAGTYVLVVIVTWNPNEIKDYTLTVYSGKSDIVIYDASVR